SDASRLEDWLSGHVSRCFSPAVTGIDHRLCKIPEAVRSRQGGSGWRKGARGTATTMQGKARPKELSPGRAPNDRMARAGYAEAAARGRLQAWGPAKPADGADGPAAGLLRALDITRPMTDRSLWPALGPGPGCVVGAGPECHVGAGPELV